MKGARRWILSIAAIAAGTLATLLGGCSESLPGEGVTVRSGYSFIGGAFQAEVAAIGLEKLGYQTISPAYVDASVLQDALRDGDMQLHLSYWHPLEAGFATRFGGDELVEHVGSMVGGVRHGYLIDKATAEEHNITNIQQLKDPKLAKLFDVDGNGMADLMGCNRSWACAEAIDRHIFAYRLKDTVEQVQQSYESLAQKTEQRFLEGKPVLYYGWTPHWLADTLVPEDSVVWLEVPFTTLPDRQLDNAQTIIDDKNVGFAMNQWGALGNREFIEANPAARRFLEQVAIPSADIKAEMSSLRDAQNNQAATRKRAEAWVDAHETEFEEWLNEAKRAAK